MSDSNRRLGTNTGHFGLSHSPFFAPLAGVATFLTSRAGFTVNVQRNVPADTIHYVHIGKTAGTTMMNAIEAINRDRVRVVRRTHQTRLRDIPQGARYFFSIRHPVSRFVSGFYSRLNKNRPSLLADWTPGEAMAFSHYTDASDLAEDLFLPGPAGARALEAMCSLGHAPMQIGWFSEGGAFLTQRPPIHIIRQEHFAKDFGDFLAAADLACDLPATRSNESPKPPPLNDKARTNIERWYAADLAFYAACEAWLADNLHAQPRRRGLDVD